MLEVLDRLDRLENRLDRLLKPIRSARSASSDQALLRRFAEKYRGDYLGFTRLVHIDSKAGRVPFELNAIQRKYNANRTQRDVCLKARRCGMSTEAICRDSWHFLCFPSAAVAIACQSGKDHQGAKTVRRILDPMVESLRARGLPLDFVENTKTSLTLDFGEWVASLDLIEAGASADAAEKAGRGARITRLHCTEEAYWEYAGATMASLRHCVPDVQFGSEIQIESTANGMGAESFESPKDADGAYVFRQDVRDAQLGTSGYKLHFFAWHEDPDNARALAPGESVEPHTDREKWLASLGVKPEQLKWYQHQLALCKSQGLLDQEAPSDPETCFLSSGRTFFDMPTLALLLQQAIAPVDTRIIHDSGAQGQTISGEEVPALRIWHLPKHDKQYVLIADPSEGTGGDPGSCIVYERGTGKHCATLWGQFRPRKLAELTRWLAIEYNRGLLVVERNNHGIAVLESLAAENAYENVYVGDDEKLGFNTTPQSRPLVLDTFETAVRERHFNTNDKFLLSEMRTFVLNKQGKFEAKSGYHDDLVMPAAIGWWIICQSVVRRPQGRGAALVA